jgi:hypothetical protein
MMRKRPINLPARPQPRIIVGFDSECDANRQDAKREVHFAFQV